MSISSVHIDISGFLYETKDLNEFNAWEWLKSFRDTLAYQRHEKEPNDYALALLEETENYSAYCAVAAIEGAAIATLENRGEIPTKETVYDFLADKKGDDYLRLKEREAAYLRTNPNAKTVWSRRANRINKSESTTSRTDNRNTATSTDQGNGQYTQPPPQQPQAKTEAPPQAKPTNEPPQAPEQEPFYDFSPTKGDGPQHVPPKILNLAYSGEFGNVKLTQDQYNELGIKFGNQQALNRAIDSLSSKLENGEIQPVPKNHYAVLVKWAAYRDDKREEKDEDAERNRYETVSEHNMRVLKKSTEFIKNGGLEKLKNGTIGTF